MPDRTGRTRRPHQVGVVASVLRRRWMPVWASAWLVDLDQVARRIVEERLPTGAHWRRVADRRAAGTEVGDRGVEVGHVEREVLAAILRPGSLDEMDLLVT